MPVLIFPLAAFQVPMEKHSHALASERENDDKSQAKKKLSYKAWKQDKIIYFEF